MIVTLEEPEISFITYAHLEPGGTWVCCDRATCKRWAFDLEKNPGAQAHTFEGPLTPQVRAGMGEGFTLCLCHSCGEPLVSRETYEKAVTEMVKV